MRKKNGPTIFRRGNRYCAVYDSPRAEGERRKQVWLYGRTEDEVRVKWLAAQQAIQEESHVDPSRKTLADLAADWLPTLVTNNLRRSTRESYEAILRDHVLPRLGRKRIQQIKPADLDRLYADLLREGNRRGKTKRGLSSRSVRYTHVVLKAVLSHAVDRNLLIRNPADRVKQPKKSGSKPDFWTVAELKAFLALTKADRMHSAWFVISRTGLRRGELLGLGWDAVDAGRLTVDRSLISVGYQVAFEPPKSAASRRTITLDAETIAVLKSWKARQIEDRLAAGDRWTDSGLVFTDAEGLPIHPDRFTKVFAARVRKSGVKQISVHDLRHTHAAHLVFAGVHAKVIQSRLGHSSIQVTLDTYGHLMEGLDGDAAQKVASLYA